MCRVSRNVGGCPLPFALLLDGVRGRRSGRARKDLPEFLRRSKWMLRRVVADDFYDAGEWSALVVPPINSYDVMAHRKHLSSFGGICTRFTAPSYSINRLPGADAFS